MALADMTQEETDARNLELCKGIAETLDLIACGDLYRDDDGEEYDASDLDEIPDDWEQVTISDYFSSTYEIRYLVSDDLEYVAVKLMVAGGGPAIWVDTETCSVRLYWWGDRASYPLTSAAVSEIDAFASELLEMRRC